MTHADIPAPTAHTRSFDDRKLGNRRVTGREQFYTPSDIAHQVLDLVEQVVPDWHEFAFLEPAGGTGTFIDAACERGATQILSWDIEPHHPLVRDGDFLDQTPPVNSAICATNPPFGRNNALSIPFFNHAANFSQLVAFVVPRSWRKWSVQNRLDTRLHLVRDVDLKVNYLDVHGKDVHAFDTLRTCIQVWQRREKTRPRVRVEERGYVGKVSPDEADVALTIFGYGCGTVRTTFPRSPNTTQMFLKVMNDRVLDALQSVDFTRFSRHTAYTEALSIQEINYLLNEHLDADPGLIRD